MTPHIVLIGDSIFDNASYTDGEPDVIAHLARLLGGDGRATLLAVDGSVADDLGEQCLRVPADCTHLVVSVGGNDALGCLDLLDAKVRSTGEGLRLLGTQVSRFEAAYRAAIRYASAVGPPLTICTIYHGDFAPPLDAVTRIALAPFNDAILRVAFEHGHRVIDLRLICTESSDYANPIEPSGKGGAKIAEAIARSCGALTSAPRASVVHAG